MYVDPPERAVRQPRCTGERLPGRAAVGRAPEAAARPARREAPRGAPRPPRGGVEEARVPRVEAEVGGAGRRIDEEDARPGRAAISRPEDAALLVRPETVPGRGDEDAVRVARVDADAGDVPRRRQADVRPGGAGIAYGLD